MITGVVLAGLILIAVTIALGILGQVAYHRTDFEPTSVRWMWWGGGILTGIIAAVCFIPYQAEYLHYQTISGEVETIEAMRLEQRFALTFEGNPQPYKITDTRAALVEPGDKLTLECVKEWEWGSTNHGFNCKWGGQA